VNRAERRVQVSDRRRDELPFFPAPFVGVRAPLLPVSALRTWGDEARRDDPCAPKSLAQLRTTLDRWLARPVVREAPCVASRSLAERLAKRRAAPSSKDGMGADAPPGCSGLTAARFVVGCAPKCRK